MSTKFPIHSFQQEFSPSFPKTLSLQRLQRRKIERQSVIPIQLQLISRQTVSKPQLSPILHKKLPLPEITSQLSYSQLKLLYNKLILQRDSKAFQYLQQKLHQQRVFQFQKEARRQKNRHKLRDSLLNRHQLIKELQKKTGIVKIKKTKPSTQRSLSSRIQKLAQPKKTTFPQSHQLPDSKGLFFRASSKTNSVKLMPALPTIQPKSAQQEMSEDDQRSIRELNNFIRNFRPRASAAGFAYIDLEKYKSS